MKKALYLLMVTGGSECLQESQHFGGLILHDYNEWEKVLNCSSSISGSLEISGQFWAEWSKYSIYLKRKCLFSSHLAVLDGTDRCPSSQCNPKRTQALSPYLIYSEDCFINLVGKGNLIPKVLESMKITTGFLGDVNLSIFEQF